MIEVDKGPALADWGDVGARLLRNDTVALAQVVRLITGHLAALRAYDLGESKTDLIQDVLASLVISLRRGELRESRAFVTYVGIIVRNKFYDACRRSANERDLGRKLRGETTSEARGLPVIDLFDLRDALADLPEKEWAVVDLHYNHGRTFDEIAIDLNMPRGSVGRLLRSALRILRDAITGNDSSVRAQLRTD